MEISFPFLTSKKRQKRMLLLLLTHQLFLSLTEAKNLTTFPTSDLPRTVTITTENVPWMVKSITESTKEEKVVLTNMESLSITREDLSTMENLLKMITSILRTIIRSVLVSLLPDLSSHTTAAGKRERRVRLLPLLQEPSLFQLTSLKNNSLLLLLKDKLTTQDANAIANANANVLADANAIATANAIAVIAVDAATAIDLAIAAVTELSTTTTPQLLLDLSTTSLINPPLLAASPRLPPH
jgi:hypothetical protein